MLHDGMLHLDKIHTKDNLIDMLTNNFGRDKWDIFRAYS